MLAQASVPMLLVDYDLKVMQANDAFWEFMAAAGPAPAGTPVADAIPAELSPTMADALTRARDAGAPILLESVRLQAAGQPECVFDLHIAPADLHGTPALIVTSTLVPDTGRRVAELTLLNDMVRVLRQQTDLERVLFTTLTCATAGYGLAFNRAFVLLVDPSGERLEGRMAVGPASEEEAHRVWASILEHPTTLEDFAAAYDTWSGSADHPLHQLVRRMRFSLKQDAARVPAAAVVQRRTIKIDDAFNDQRVGPELCEALSVPEFVVAPMFVADEATGVIMADNRFSGRQIGHGDLRLLSLFAQHAGIAIESAQAYHAIQARGQELERAYARLKETQEELVRIEKLAAIGEMAARVAHDVRNPIVTIGGWAQDLQEEPEDVATVTRASAIIAEQAMNVERILSMLVQPLASREILPEPTDLNRLVHDTLIMQEPVLSAQNIELRMELAEDLPQVRCDRAQIRRALANLLDNAAGAMPEGGVLSARTGADDKAVWLELADTGVGMVPEVAAQIFDPFFTTRHYGSGLGLAIVWDTITAHGWSIDVHTEPGKGTSFILRAPLQQRRAGAAESSSTPDEHRAGADVNSD